MLKAAFALALCLSFLSPARADWQWTKWGMSPEGLVAASGGKARLATEEETQKKSHGKQGGPQTKLMLAVGTHRAGDFQFEAFFLFDPPTRGLVCAQLESGDESSFTRLRDQL